MTPHDQRSSITHPNDQLVKQCNAIFNFHTQISFLFTFCYDISLVFLRVYTIKAFLSCIIGIDDPFEYRIVNRIILLASNCVQFVFYKFTGNCGKPIAFEWNIWMPFEDFSPDPFPLSPTAVHGTRHAISCTGRTLNGLAQFWKETISSGRFLSHSFHSRRRRLRERRAAGVFSKRGRKRMYRDENRVSTSVSQWEHFLSQREPQDRGKSPARPTERLGRYGLKRNSCCCHCRTRRNNLVRDFLSSRSGN